MGFRPFICRIAARHNLLGEVDNRTDGVAVIVQGDMKTIDRFSNDILQNAPPASRIKSIEVNSIECDVYDNFRIADSKNIDNHITEISPDIAVCNECLDDMQSDPGRIDYPFINCTNCGPRFSIISALPYDRPGTTMNSFRMCRRCDSEYNDIPDRRFHAQPIACNSCGPEYLYKDEEKETGDLKIILEEVAGRIAAGKSVAVKGIGGYFFMCDALNNNAVKELRKRKQRDSKPFAVMFRDIGQVRKYCYINQAEVKELKSWRRPILILKQKELLCENLNMGLSTVGAMLPYMPFHYLLFRTLRTPAIVLTSGNISDEPIIKNNSNADKQLFPIAGALLSYNREILNRVDDSVVRIVNNKISLIRRSRGFVPRPVDLRFEVEGIIALGGEEKNTFCLGKGSQAIMSQYIGDLKNAATFDFFTGSIDRFSGLFKFRPSFIACDLHPAYLSTHHAEKLKNELDIPLFRIQHHHAHIASCMAEHGLDDEVIGVSLDGTGYGPDGYIWGSEFMIAGLKSFRRYMHFDYVPLPGGDRVVAEPWRMAFSYIYKYFGNGFDYSSLPVFRKTDIKKLQLVKNMIDNDINSPLSAGTGRLFDAVAAILDLCHVASFDSEGPMRLESVINEQTAEVYSYSIGESVNFAVTISEIIDELSRKNISLISAKFHNTIAKVITDIAVRIREETSLNRVVLSGGVFQNKYLLEKSLYLLNRNRFRVFTNHLVPANDGGISLGQLVIASKLKESCV